MKKISLFFALLSINAFSAEFKPEYYIHAGVAELDIVTKPLEDYGRLLRLAVVDASSGIGIGTTLCYGFNIGTDTVSGTFFPIELYWTPYAEMHNYCGKRTVRMVQVCFCGTFWGGEFLEQGEDSPDYQLFQNGTIIDISVNYTEGLFWALRAGFAATSGTDYNLKEYNGSYIYASLQLQLGGWFVKGKRVDKKESKEKLVVTAAISDTNYTDLSTVQNPDSIYKDTCIAELFIRKDLDSIYKPESLYVDSVKTAPVSEEEGLKKQLADILYVSPLVFGECGKKEFYETADRITNNIKEYFPDDIDFRPIRKTLYKYIEDRKATIKHNREHYKRAVGLISGIIAGLYMYNKISNFEPQDEYADPCPSEGACVEGCTQGCTVIGTPFAVIGSVIAGQKATALVTTESISEKDVRILNKIIKDYNKKMKEKIKTL